jgi:hypothetical protein
MSATRILVTALLLVTMLSVSACSTTTGIVIRTVGVRVLRGVVGSYAERDTLCTYYTEHREEVEAVREFAKANWERVPENYKPALLAVNEQLDACEAITPDGTKRTTAKTLLDALKRAVKLYRELKAAGVL